MLTISRLARRFGLSRSTLLYYDSIGLLIPSERSPSNYRLYSDADVERMELIDVYRRAGLPLADIARVLDSDGDSLADLLRDRLQNLNGEIRKLRCQQQMIVELMQGGLGLQAVGSLDKQGWISILRATGLSDDAMMRWHVEFERLSPAGHGEFLESLAIEAEEIAKIRERARASK
jgi:DNA-binding transcriptional MerR regulator